MKLSDISVIQQILDLYKDKKFLDLQKKEKSFVGSVEKAITQDQIDQIQNHIEKI